MSPKELDRRLGRERRCGPRAKLERVAAGFDRTAAVARAPAIRAKD